MKHRVKELEQVVDALQKELKEKRHRKRHEGEAAEMTAEDEKDREIKYGSEGQPALRK